MGDRIEMEYQIVHGTDEFGLEEALFKGTTKTFEVRAKVSKNQFNIDCHIYMVRSKDRHKKWEIEGEARFPGNMANKKLSGRLFEFKAKYNTFDRNGWLTITEIIGL